MKKQGRSIAPFIYLLVLLAVFSWALNAFGQKTNTIPYSQLVELFQNEQVSQFLVEGNTITLILRSPINGKNTITSGLADPEGFRSQMQSLFDEQIKSGVLSVYDFVADKTYTPYDFILPLLVAGGVLLLAWTFIMARMNGAGGGNPMAQFGKARTVLGVPDNRKVTFEDVAGADEEKQELEEVVDFLRDPAKYTAMGARIPHGLLLVGPPGTGKTLLARATAGEAGVQILTQQMVSEPSVSTNPCSGCEKNALAVHHIRCQQRDTPRASLAGVFHNRYRNTYRSSHDFLPRLRCLEQTAVAHQPIQLDGFSFGQQLHSYFKGCHSRIQLCAHKVSERQAAFRTAYQKRPSLLHVNDRLTRQIVAAQKAAAVFFSLRRFGI